MDPIKAVQTAVSSIVSTAATGRCETVADDGAQCVRAAHEHDVDAHDFAGQQPTHERIDGGRRWSDWISMVHATRDLLMPQHLEKELGREGRVGEWPETFCRALLLEIARTVELTVGDDEGVAVIRDSGGGR